VAGDLGVGGVRSGGVSPSERIDEVLADLGGQLEAAEAAELAAEVADRTRRETALLRAADCLRGSIGSTVSVSTVHGDVHGELTDVGPDWLLLEQSRERSAVIPLPAVVAVCGLRGSAVASSSIGPVAHRLDLRHVLRAVVRDRRPVRLVLRDGRSYDGILNRCGADFVELTAAPSLESLRSGAGPVAGIGGGGAGGMGVVGTRLVPLPAIVTVHLG
jgi:Protein of unknown function (DUF2642)